MGLLDDAIREHIELKRLRGADPTEVAREEHDALGPVSRERDAEPQALEGEEGDTATPEDRTHGDVALGEGHSSEAPEAAHDPDFANVGQETAELDMRTVLDEEHGDPEAAAATETTTAGEASGEAEHRAEDSLEWEVPADSPHEASGQAADSAHAAEEPGEDVLEETPDFLRDTPEQERLWFEQQPPRDFDFDK